MSMIKAAELYDIALDVTQAKPLYLQLYDAIREQVLTSRLLSGFRLPASRELARALRVSRNTVQRAYDQLMAEGYLQARPGSGVFVAVELPDSFLRANKIAVKKRLPDCHGKRMRLSAFAQQMKVVSNMAAPRDQPFTPGMPDLNGFPQQLWLKLWHKALRQSTSVYLDKNESAGLKRLRQTISDYLRYARAVNCQPEQVILTNGAQQALDLICRVFLNPGDTVVSEDPVYMGMRNLFAAYQADVLPCAVDHSGMQVDLLNQYANESPSLIYTTPAHQYPLGSIMPIERRLQLLSFAERVGSYVIEDDYDGEFHFDCKPLPSLQGMDQSGRVIYVGSFSKVLLPTLRLGYLIVPQHLVAVFTQMKRLVAGMSDPLRQQVVADFIQQGHFGRHLKRMRLLYAERLQQILPLLKQKFGDQFKLLATGAGMHLVLMSNKKIDDVVLAQKIERKGFGCKALSPYYINHKKQYGFIVGFSNVNQEQMMRGVKAIFAAVS